MIFEVMLSKLESSNGGKSIFRHQLLFYALFLFLAPECKDKMWSRILYVEGEKIFQLVR